MRIASASAASMIAAPFWRAVSGSTRRAVGGAGGSWSNRNASSATKPVGSSATNSDELFIVTLGLAGDRQRALVLEPADDRDDAALRLLDDRAALRRQQLELLVQHLGAARRQVAEDLLLDLSGHAAQRQREVLLVDLLHDLLNAAVVDLDDVL